jgi:hypothetical protein
MVLTQRDISNIEAEDDVDEYDYFASVQRAINVGSWTFQGSFGRTMMDAIVTGRCLLGTKEFRDYYGNPVPSRDQVKAGTKGSPEYVAEQHGQEWLDFISNIV